MENRAYTDEEMQEAQDMIDNLTAELDECRASKIGYALYTETMDKMRAREAERDALQAENARLRGQLSQLMDVAKCISMGTTDNVPPFRDAPRGVLMNFAADIYRQIQQENSHEDHD